MGKLPASWAKYLAAGSISASLDVFDEEGDKELSLELTVDRETGVVSAAPFKLGIGGTYRFVVIFHYWITGQQSIPYAYADFNHLIDDFGEEVTYTENDIRYGHNTDDPNIASALSQGVLPDLDLDRDGWTNWEELRDRVDPQDAGSVPIPPTVEVVGAQDGTSTTATITVIAKDNAHVERLRLADPVCGVTILSDTQQTNADGSVTRTLVLRLDLLSVSKTSRFLQGVADDGVTPSQDDNEVLQFSVSGTASQPYFAFTEPEENSEIEGPTVFRGVACSRSEIDTSSLQFVTSEIAEYRWTGLRNELSGDFIFESEPVDTEQLPDGNNLLRVQVRDANGKTGEGARSYLVVNDSQIKVVNPIGRRWVFGNEQIVVSVKGLSDSNIVIAETVGDFNLKSSTAGGLVGVLDVSNLEDGSVVPINFKAVRADGSEVTRQVDFTVRNKPQIEVFPKATNVFKDWSAELQFRIVNARPGGIFLDGQPPAPIGAIQCSDDGIAERVTVCTGIFPAKVSQSRSFTLSAERSPTSEEDCQYCTNEKATALTMIGTLPEDLPVINVTVDGDDEAVTPSRLRTPSESPAKNYRWFIKDSSTGEISLQEDLVSGETISVSGLKPRNDYREFLQILSGPGGNVEGEMFKDVTTGDIGLVGWWRFKDDPNLQDCPGESSTRTVCDYSGKNNHGIPTDEMNWTSQMTELSDGFITFNGETNSVEIPNSSWFNIDDEFSISCLINAQLSQEFVEVFTKDNPSSGPYTLVLEHPNQVIFGIYTYQGGVGSWTYITTLVSDLVGTDVRITATFSEGVLKLFLNNIESGSVSVNGTIVNNNQIINIGYSPYWETHYKGNIDECLVFSREINIFSL